MQMKGIDVSRYQGDIDFEQVKNSGIDFVIIKAGEWDEVSPTFESQYAAAKAAGMHIGAYWFCDGETIADIKMEANACIETIKGKQFDFPIYMDFVDFYRNYIFLPCCIFLMTRIVSYRYLVNWNFKCIYISGTIDIVFFKYFSKFTNP